MNLSICKLPTQTQAAFWFMLFNWTECNNFSITIGPERRKILTDYYSQSNDPNSRSVQKIFRGLTKSGLFSALNPRLTGLEPATSAVTGRCSNQLNYSPYVFNNILIPV